MTGEKNISQIEIESIIRNAELIERYRKDIETGKQKDMKREQYAYVFEAFVLKYLPKTNTRKWFRERTRFTTNKTFNKFLYGTYKDVAKIDDRLLMKVCIGLALTKQESYDFFYACGHNLYRENKECVERKILDNVKNPSEKLNETMKGQKTSENVYKANKIYKQENKRGIYVNCKREEDESEEVYGDYEEI